MSTLTKTSEEVLDVVQLRSEFPALHQQIRGKRLVYLDNAATSHKPRMVLDAMQRFYESDNSNIHRGVHTLSQRATSLYEEVREKVRSFLNARETAEIIFTKGCTESINLVASSWGRANLKPGDEIVLSHMEHHSNIVPWQMAAEQAGATIRVVPVSDEGVLDLDAYASLLNERTKLVGIVHVSNALGTINPVAEMAAMAHRAGATVLIDGAQAGPHEAIDVQAIDADFYTLSCHKMYAPTGVGVLYGKKEILRSIPPYQGGGDMIRTVSFEGTTYADLPNKFEAGTPNVAGVVGLGAAIDFILGLGRDRIAQHERALTEYGTEVLRSIPGVRIVGTAPDKTSVLSFVVDGIHPHDLGTILDNQGVAIRAGHHCTMPLMKRFGIPATARASIAVYNTPDELDRLGEAVRKAQELMA
ncbi:MAG: cysteine desulfurase [Fimbriimonadaceae bacterium]